MTPPPALPILSLPPATTSRLRSSIVLPSFPAILVELVQNALDAQSTSIVVSVDLERWNMKCEDDGVGLSEAELEKIGEERYWTSKLSEEGMGRVNTFGFRGEALASIACVGVLEILSRSRSKCDGGSCSKTVQDGVTIPIGEARARRGTPGTTVWARQVFHKWPVRRRPHSTGAGRAALLTSLRSSLATLVLLYPLVSFTLTDLVASHHLLTVTKMREGVLGRWKQLWGRAGVEKVYEFDESENHGDLEGFSASGFFSLTAAHSKASQYIYVNSRPLSNSFIHKLINHHFALSTFAKHASSHLVAPSAPPLKSSTRKSPKKSIERHPIFLLHLRAPLGMIDVTLEPGKRVIEFEDEERVEKFVKGIVEKFLRAHGFLPPAAGEAGETTSPAATPGGDPTGVSPRLNLERFIASDDLGRPLSPLPVPRSKAGLSPPHIFVDQQGEDERSPIQWIDPAIRQTFMVDPRTGNSWRKGSRVNACERAEEDMGRSDVDVEIRRRGTGIVDRAGLKRKLGVEGDEEQETPEWIVDSLSKWENPVFPLVKSQIPTLPRIAQDQNLKEIPINSVTNKKRSRPGYNPLPNRVDLSNISDRFQNPLCLPSVPPLASNGNGGGGGDHKFTREDLKNSELIAQVDRKFLLVKLNDPSSSISSGCILLMIDQHAASERVRVEGFLKDLSGRIAAGEGPLRKVLKEPRQVVISREEELQLRSRVDEFGRWGIGIEFLDAPNPILEQDIAEEQDYAQILITAVPHLVADRLLSDPKLLQELIRSFLSQLSSLPPSRSILLPPNNEPNGSWGNLVKNCPKVMMELINSKSCRGAIMFNDPLTNEQCRKLLAQLAETDFPFQCAHGRPSLVPIVNLSHRTSGEEERKIDWSRFRK